MRKYSIQKSNNQKEKPKGFDFVLFIPFDKIDGYLNILYSLKKDVTSNEISTWGINNEFCKQLSTLMLIDSKLRYNLMAFLLNMIDICNFILTNKNILDNKNCLLNIIDNLINYFTTFRTRFFFNQYIDPKYLKKEYRAMQLQEIKTFEQIILMIRTLSKNIKIIFNGNICKHLFIK